MANYRQIFSWMIVSFCLFLSSTRIDGLGIKAKAGISIGGVTLGALGVYLAKRELKREQAKKNHDESKIRLLKGLQYASAGVSTASALYGAYQGYNKYQNVRRQREYDKLYNWQESQDADSPKTAQELMNEWYEKAFDFRTGALADEYNLSKEQAEIILGHDNWPAVKQAIEKLALDHDVKSKMTVSILDREIQDYIKITWAVIGLMENLSQQPVKVRIMQTKEVLELAIRWIKRIKAIEKDLTDIKTDIKSEAHAYLTKRGLKLKKLLGQAWDKFKAAKWQAFKDVLSQLSIQVIAEYDINAPELIEISSLAQYIKLPVAKLTESKLVNHAASTQDKESVDFGIFLDNGLKDLLEECKGNSEKDLLQKIIPLFIAFGSESKQLMAQRFLSEKDYISLAVAVEAALLKGGLTVPTERLMDLSTDSILFALATSNEDNFLKINALKSLYDKTDLFEKALSTRNVLAATLCCIESGDGQLKEQLYKIVRCSEGTIEDWYCALFPGFLRARGTFREAKIGDYQRMLRDRKNLFRDEVGDALIARGFSEAE